MRTQCDNCGKIRNENQIVPLAEVPRLGERLDPNGTVPAGECRSCGALVYRLETMDRRRKLILKMARRYESEGDLELDDDDRVVISESVDNGCYVRMWKWIDFTDTVISKEVA